jgi:tetratricopeptide (TPR) repeat protein
MQNFTKAIEYANTALEIAIEVGDREKQSACYGNLSQAYSYLGHFTKAIEYANTALEIAIEVGDKRTQALCYGNMYFAYDGLKDFETAAEYQMKSLQMAIDIEDKGSQADGYANLGVAFLNLGDSKTSIELQKEGLRIAEEIGNLDSQSITALSLCDVYYSKNRPRKAYDYCKRSIESLEMISERLIQEEHKISLLTKASAYELMVPICLKLKLREEAVIYTERAKSRVLLDMLAKTEIKPTVELTEEFQSLIQEEEKYVIKLREIQTRHLRKIARSPEKPGEIDHVLKQLKNVYEKIAKFDPEYVLMRSGRPLGFKEIVKLL